MIIRKAVAVIVSFCLMVSVLLALPSINAGAMTADAVVIGASGASVRSEADPTASLLALAAKDNTFLLREAKTGTDGAVWYKIIYSPSVTGWVSSADASAITASSAADDPYTLYLERYVRVTDSSFVLRSAPGFSNSEVATVSRNERMVAVGYDNDSAGITWYEVRYGDLNGWIRRTAVEITNICTASAPLDCSEKTPVIYLSPSRQPANLFAAGNTNEYEQMTRVSVALKVILEQRYDCRVILAEYETPISKFYRPLDARLAGADIYLAIHSNAAGSAGHGYGTQAYYYPAAAQNRLMAENLVKSISAISPFSDDADGAYNGMSLLGGVGYGEVRDPGGFGMISCLLEVEFHDHADSAKWIIEHTDDIAGAIADGLDDTFDFRPKGSSPTTTVTTASAISTGGQTTATTTTRIVQDGYSPLGSTTATTAATASTASTTSAASESSAASTTSTRPTEAQPTVGYETVRAGGADRVETALKISALGWDSADTVIIASGSSYPDALAGVPLSAAADAPILLTVNGEEERLMTEIARLGAGNAYILGGEAAVSSGVQSALSSAGVTCRRLSGQNRYETCVVIANELVRLNGGASDTLFFASGDNFPDALAAGSAAAANGSPILYIGSDADLQPCVAEFALSGGCGTAFLLGGEAAVSQRGQSDIERLGFSVERISGADRYATAAAVVERFADMFAGNGVALATGKSFPDALAGGAHAAKLGVPVLLVGNSVSMQQLDCVGRLSKGDVYVYGGANAVGDAVARVVLMQFNTDSEE